MWSAFERALDTVKATKTSDIGAGQKATLLNGLLLSRLKYFWGTPVFPDEPDSLSAARLQREIDIMDMRLWLQPDQPWLESARQTAFMLMWERFGGQQRTLYSTAKSAEEYLAALEALEHPLVPPTPGRIDYTEIKRRLPLLDYIMRFDEVRQTGRTYRGHCPIHEDKTPSMVIYPNDGIGGKWWCYVCNEGGDVIDYERARLRNDKAIPA